MLSARSPEISIVVPTRNRRDHLARMLLSVDEQSVAAKEILVVDSSDDTSYHSRIVSEFPSLPLKFIGSFPSVCAQRNLGIRSASCEWVLLLDDDIVLESNYLQELAAYINDHPDCNAVAGRLMQLEGKEWVDQYPPPSVRALLFRFVFQLPVWGEVQQNRRFQKNFFLRMIVMKYYVRRRNTFTLAGWPLITRWGNTFQTSVYSLGADLIKRDWLLKSPYSEALDANGIGDNYGVAIGFPGEHSIHVIDTTKAFHHRAHENRLRAEVSYYRRVLALHFFIRNSPRFGKRTLAWFFWSLLGNLFYFGIRFKTGYAFASIKAICLLLLRKNPYIMRDKEMRLSVGAKD
jgi:glycosyltransferase involved in cell wall biosynthesis